MSLVSSVFCGNSSPHTFHAHTRSIEQTCSGQTACGNDYHDPHPITVEQSVWCDGVCDCGLDVPHGPGRHK